VLFVVATLVCSYNSVDLLFVTCYFAVSPQITEYDFMCKRTSLWHEGYYDALMHLHPFCKSVYYELGYVKGQFAYKDTLSACQMRGLESHRLYANFQNTGTFTSPSDSVVLRYYDDDTTHSSVPLLRQNLMYLLQFRDSRSNRIKRGICK